MRHELIPKGVVIVPGLLALLVGLAADTPSSKSQQVAARIPSNVDSRSAGTTKDMVALADGLNLGQDASAENYRLGAGDRLRIRFYERADLSGEFAVRSDGRIGIPLLGSFLAEGKDVNQLEQDIVAAYITATGRTPQILIDVLERRPFYVVGMVQKAGAYPYVPSMTTLHAIALAGGVVKTPAADLPTGLFVTANHEISKLRQAEASLRRLIARTARLFAEREGRNSVGLPPQLLRLSDRNEAEMLIAAENNVLRNRAAALEGRTRGYRAVIEKIDAEIRELEAKREQAREKTRLHNLQLADIKTLYEKGLQRRSQFLTLQAQVASDEAELRDIGARIARAERDREEARRNLASVDDDHKLQIEQELLETDRQIAAVEPQIDSAKKIIYQTTGVSAEIAAMGGDIQLAYTIVRRNGDGYRFIEADETRAILPGDILRVSVKPLATSLAAGPSLLQRIGSQATSTVHE